MITYQKGINFLTFDDHDLDGWTEAIPVFAKYNAHATFSFSGEIGQREIDCMKKLQTAGHTVGLHTLHHADAPEYIAKNGPQAYFDNEIKPQLDACSANGIKVSTFAFPNNRYDHAALTLLTPFFRRFRAGSGVPREAHLADCDQAFIQLPQLPERTVFGGRGLGEYYATKQQDVFDALQRAASRCEAIVFFSHAIAPGAKSVNMPLELLIPILEKSQELNLSLLGFDDLDR